jgi:8-oxo-dGTP pyrophosphatase MutT (NUDIX family)
VRSREELLAALGRHAPFDAHEARMLAQITNFVEGHADCFERSQRAGHVTGSAWVVDQARERTLLVHHRRLGRWLQPGGHADGNPDVLEVAIREAEEETGLPARPVSAVIFDVDAHQIPARGAEPAHIHYDIRFLLEADGRLAPVVSEESHEVRWVALAEVATLNTDASVLRLVARTLAPEPSRD